MKFSAPLSVLIAVLCNGVCSQEQDPFVVHDKKKKKKHHKHNGLRTSGVACSTTYLTSNDGDFILGVDPDGGLGMCGTGIENIKQNPNYDAVHREGWGASAMVDGSTFYGFSRKYNNGNLETPDPVISTGSTAATSVKVSTGPLKVTHDYEPSSDTDDLFKVTVTYENTSSTQTLTDLRYRRIMDWDLDPTPECYSFFYDGDDPKYLEYATNNGYGSPNPLLKPNPFPDETIGPDDDYEYYYARNGKPYTVIGPCPGSDCPAGGVFDIGPTDQGALWNFQFDSVSIPPMGSFSFKIYFGVADDKAAADTAVNAVGAAMGSYGFTAFGASEDYYRSGSCTDANAGSDYGVHIFAFGELCDLPPGGCVANGDQYCCPNDDSKYNVCSLDSSLNLVTSIKEVSPGTKCCQFYGNRILQQFIDMDCP
jgi:hypothetical protein